MEREFARDMSTGEVFVWPLLTIVGGMSALGSVENSRAALISSNKSKALGGNRPTNSKKHTTTFGMCKRTEGTTWAEVLLLDVIALGALVDLRVKLLLSPGVTIGAIVFVFAVGRVAPLVTLLHTGTGG